MAVQLLLSEVLIDAHHCGPQGAALSQRAPLYCVSPAALRSVVAEAAAVLLPPASPVAAPPRDDDEAAARLPAGALLRLASLSTSLPEEAAEARALARQALSRSGGPPSSGAGRHPSPPLWAQEAQATFQTLDHDAALWRRTPKSRRRPVRSPAAGTCLPASLVPLQRSVLFVASAEEERQTLLAQMKDLLAALTAYEPYAGPFRVPVRPSEAPHYEDIVKQPMDLQTMAQRVEAGVYTAPQDGAVAAVAAAAAASLPEAPPLLSLSLPPALRAFVGDLQLIFHNCRLYNTAPGNEFVAWANAMEAKAQTLLHALPLVVVAAAEEAGAVAATSALSDAALAEQRAQAAEPRVDGLNGVSGVTGDGEDHADSVASFFSLQRARQRTYDAVSEQYRVRRMASRRFCWGTSLVKGKKEKKGSDCRFSLGAFSTPKRVLLIPLSFALLPPFPFPFSHPLPRLLLHLQIMA